jgi:hypothetical protein
MQMTKLKMDADAVQVETFQVDDGEGRDGGTVIAFAGSFPLTCPDTCLVSCSPCA